MESYNWEDIKKLILERERYLICGSNVIHLQYFEGLLSERNIEDFENKLKQVGLELSRFKMRENKLTCAGINKSVPETFFLIVQPIIGELIKDKETSEKWKIIKCFMFTTWKNLREISYNKNTYNDANKNKLSFGLKVNLDTNTSFNFKIQDDFNEESIQIIFDKILVFIKEHQFNEKYKIIEYVYFDTKEDKWVKTDIQKELLELLMRNDI